MLNYLLATHLMIVAFAMPALAQGDIITAEQFMQLVKTDKNVVIIDASKEKDYTLTHIKDAVNVPYKSLEKDGEIDGLIFSPAELAAIFASKGINDNNTIVVYDAGTQKYSSRVYWILKYLGAPNVKILQKDMDNWRKVRVPITKMPSKRAATTFTPKVNNSIVADLAYVKEGKALIVDARTSDEYTGTSEKSKGHIPGAININYKEVLTPSEAFKSKSELESLIAQYKLSPNQPIVIYCNTGIIAAVIYTALTNVMGWTNVKVYDGAYKEWEASGNTLESKEPITTVKKAKASSSDGGC
ncbi:MAG: sulfurtransferase [Bacteroidales bacterium]|jgi:thiosulfate/3-mercaptopyruvate sulfurtransferase